MKDQTHLVLDLETLGLKEDAVILTVGWAIVKKAEIIQQNEVKLNLAQQIEHGRSITPDTLKWWLAGDKAEACKAMDALPEYRAGVAMDVLRNSVIGSGVTWEKVIVWGNSPNFDCDILGHMFETVVKCEKPWKFYNERDMRTLRALHPHERSRPRIPHDAMWDAVAEAEDLCNYLRTLP
jgi:exodeoxyribonuclease VIII